MTGIYWILNKINNHIYIGSTANFRHRKNQHLKGLKDDNHHSKYLQREYNKYGKENFEIEILIECPQNMLLWYEQQFIDKWNPEYNGNKIAGSMLGFHHSIESRNKMSKSKKGKPRENFYYPEISKKKMSDFHKNTEWAKKIYHGLVSPNGEVYDTIENLHKFCRERDLDSAHILYVLNGKRKSHKGWAKFLG